MSTIRVREYTTRNRAGAIWGAKIYQGSRLAYDVALDQPGFSSQSAYRMAEAKVKEIVCNLTSEEGSILKVDANDFSGPRASELRRFLNMLLTAQSAA